MNLTTIARHPPSWCCWAELVLWFLVHWTNL